MGNFTDLFIRRPVLAMVVSLTIFVLGLRAIGSLPVLQYPSTNSATISITTVYPRRRSEYGSGLHYNAAGTGDRPGQRHRLHDLDQPDQHLDHHRLSGAQS
jgi:hypothetical protein